MARALVENDRLTVRLITWHEFQGQLGECIMKWRVSAVVNAPAAPEIAASLAQAWAPVMRAWMGANASYVGVGVKVTSAPVEPEVMNATFSGAGTNVGGSLPTQVSGLIRHKAGAYYTSATGKQRPAQGRMYIPFPWKGYLGDGGEDMTDNGLAALEAIRAAISISKNIVGIGGNATIELGTVVTEGPGPVFVKTFKKSLESSAVRAWATQRRRGEFGQPNPNPIGG